ncbi:MAG TPA: HAD-IA family hydrolase [Pyrinomonadaceae bacterium]|nr:HAD-IA family hydrolase [Pyrinomonadaceae bacterium]
MSRLTKSISAILFDWDGTVVDSAQLGLNAYEKAFAELGVPFDHETYQAVYSPNWLSVYEGLGLPKEQWQRADELWTQHYGDQNAELIEYAAGVIAELKEKNYCLGVVSSGNEVRVNREIRELGLTSFFDVVICHEQITNRKPHPEGLETAMRMLGSTREETCYIGDTPEDIEMGKRANVLTVGVRSTYPTSWKLQSAKPDIYLESFAGLTTHF